MMKMKPVYLFLSLALLCACSGSDEELSTVAQQSCNALELTVSAGGFVTDSSAPGTRATDNGATTIFVNNDRVGVIVLENGTLKANNLPYQYNGSSWSFDAATANGEGSGKSVYYYDDKATDVTYIVYYPYSTIANGVTSIDGADGLKSEFIPKDNQQSEADYRASDLMFWTSSSGSPQKTLAATLTHAYNSVSLLPQVHYTLDNGDDFVHPSPAISDVNFIMGDKIVYPYKAADGSYRCILPSGLTNNSVRCFYTFDHKTYSKDLTVSLAGANTRYSSTQRVNAGSYSLANAQVGDFYCKNSSNEGYLIPGDIVSLTENQQNDCVGVVYWVGDEAFEEDPLLKTKHSSCTHGLVASLHDVSSGTPWSSEYEDITNEWLSKLENSSYDITTLKETGKMQGYANTQALDGYNKSDRVKDTPKREVLPIGLIQTYASSHPAPTNSSGWYFPSVKELKYMCWGQNASGNTAGLKKLNEQFEKVSGSSPLQSGYSWSSTEHDRNWAWYVRFDDGSVLYYLNKGYSCRLRAALAF